jgi:hypothetical protein
MVIKLQEKNAPISNGTYVSGAKSSISSPTFSHDGNNENSLSKLSAHSESFSVPYSSTKAPFIGNGNVNCGISTLAPKKKSVRFDTCSSDSQKIHCRTYTSDEILTSIDRKERWYSSSEIKKMRTETYNEALAARSNELSYLKQFQDLHSICMESTANLAQRKELAHIVATSHYRGLESLTFVETIRLKQRQTIQEILAAQEDFRDLLSPEELMLELQALSIKLSTCSSLLAHMMGLGDANEAVWISASQNSNCISLCERNEQHKLQQEVKTPQASGGYINSSRYEI